MLQKNRFIPLPAAGIPCSTRIGTCSSLLGKSALPGRQTYVTSIQQREGQSVLTAIDDLLPQIRKRAQATEDLRRLPDETVQELEDIGFFTLLQPEQWRGLQCDPTLFYEAVRRLASACGSTGWVSSIIGVHNWHLALFDQQAQEEVWGQDTNVRISSSYAPMGAGVVVDGGYLVSGSWNWSSGCGHATGAFLGGPVVKDVFVPRHRFLSYKAMNDGTAGGYETNSAPVYKMPWGTMHPTTISAPIVGMAYGAYDAHVEHQGKRVRAAFAGEKAKDDPFAKVRIAEAASDIDAAWRQLIGNVSDEYALLSAGKEIPFELRARARRDQVRATGRAIASVDRLFEASGATALANDQPVQRFWRDAHAGRVHAANDPERAYVIFGNHEFGLPPGDTMV